MQLSSIQLRYCVLGGLRICHFDEGESAGLAGFAIGNDVDTLDVPILRKGGVQVILSGLVAQISDEESRRNDRSPFPVLSRSRRVTRGAGSFAPGSLPRRGRG